MPIHCPIATQRITQDEFKQIAGEVMPHVFTIHNEFGRFFDEQIYTKELVDRMDGVELEVPVTVTHDSFSKIYFIDALIRRSSLFEFKAADAIHPRHRGQTLNYLLLLDLGHGKVINVRPESAGHEFVNCPARLTELRHPTMRATGSVDSQLKTGCTPLANHHDNFDCFDSIYQPWNSVNIGPKKDIVGEWAKAARQAGLRFGVTVHPARAWTWV
jgi:GxxExxY protein